MNRLYGEFRKLPGWVQAAAVGAAAFGAREVYESMTEKDLTGEVVVITGAASGIGRLMAIQLAKCGCRLALWDLNGNALQDVVKEIESFGGEARAYAVDVTDRERVYELSRIVTENFGQVDILINNAGIVSGKTILDNNDALMEKTVQVNTIAHFWTLKAFLPGMLKRNHGHIVTIASLAGIQPVAGLIDYCASKFGAVGTAESLRMELRRLEASEVHCTCVCPSFIDTGMFQGAKSAYEWFCPILTPDYVVQRIVTAMKRNTPNIIIPRTCYLSPMIRSICPDSIAMAVTDLFKVNESMDDFVQTRSH